MNLELLSCVLVFVGVVEFGFLLLLVSDVKHVLRAQLKQSRRSADSLVRVAGSVLTRDEAHARIQPLSSPLPSAKESDGLSFDEQMELVQERLQRDVGLL